MVLVSVGYSNGCAQPVAPQAVEWVHRLDPSGGERQPEIG